MSTHCESSSIATDIVILIIVDVQVDILPIPFHSILLHSISHQLLHQPINQLIIALGNSLHIIEILFIQGYLILHQVANDFL